jgi:hypothetical protein
MDEKIEAQGAKQLQVVIKIRRIEIPPQASFDIDWHVEGVIEGAVASAMVRMDTEPEPINLMFGHRINPDLKTELALHSGGAVVFSSTLPLKIVDLNNRSGAEPKVRHLLMFYIIDPDNPIPSTIEELDPLYIHSLIESQLDQSQGTFPINFTNLIVDYATSTEFNAFLKQIEMLENDPELVELRKKIADDPKVAGQVRGYYMSSNVVSNYVKTESSV